MTQYVRILINSMTQKRYDALYSLWKNDTSDSGRPFFDFINFGMPEWVHQTNDDHPVWEINEIKIEMKLDLLNPLPRQRAQELTDLLFDVEKPAEGAS